MYNYKNKTSFISPEMPKTQANKTGLIIMIAYFYIRKKLNIIRYVTCFSVCLELVLIQWIIIGFEAKLEKIFYHIKPQNVIFYLELKINKY